MATHARTKHISFLHPAQTLRNPFERHLDHIIQLGSRNFATTTHFPLTSIVSDIQANNPTFDFGHHSPPYIKSHCIAQLPHHQSTGLNCMLFIAHLNLQQSLNHYQLTFARTNTKTTTTSFHANTWSNPFSIQSLCKTVFSTRPFRFQ